MLLTAGKVGSGQPYFFSPSPSLFTPKSKWPKSDKIGLSQHWPKSSSPRGARRVGFEISHFLPSPAPIFDLVFSLSWNFASFRGIFGSDAAPNVHIPGPRPSKTPKFHEKTPREREREKERKREREMGKKREILGGDNLPRKRLEKRFKDVF